jgi:hypothetical protein
MSCKVLIGPGMGDAKEFVETWLSMSGDDDAKQVSRSTTTTTLLHLQPTSPLR